MTEWDSTNQECKFYSSINFEIYYSEFGYSEYPQKYIVDIYKNAVAESWKFNRKSSDTK